MTPTLETRWSALRPATDDAFQLYDASHPLDWYLGCQPDGGRSLLLVLSSQPKTVREMRGLRTEIRRRDDGRWALLFRLTQLDLQPVFNLLAEDLIESSRSAPAAARSAETVARRLTIWVRLFDRAPSGLLDMTALRGLCGELFVLERFLLAGQRTPVAVVTSWTGPLDADQDFQIPGRAWEVKTIRPGATGIHIASERQLEHSGVLELLVLTLIEHEAAGETVFTPEQLVSRIRNLLNVDAEATTLFDDRLLAAGYVPHPHYAELLFSAEAMAVFSVTPDFPRIRPGNIPTGISNVAYELALAYCAPFRKTDDVPEYC